MKKLFGAVLVTLCLLSINASAWTRYGGGWSCGMVTEKKEVETKALPYNLEGVKEAMAKRFKK